MSTFVPRLDHLPRPMPASAPVLTTIGAAGIAAAITCLWHGQRAVMDLGGACATGGPYEIATPCPDGALWLVAPAIPLIFLLLPVFALGAEQMCRGGGILAAAGWPALFCSLGANFAWYAITPPFGGGIEWGWVVCAVVFFGLGVPVALLLPRIWRALEDGRGRLALTTASAAAAGVVGGIALSGALA